MIDLQSLEQLFDQAMALTPERRNGFIDAACAEDVELKQKLRSLIEGCAESDTYLEKLSQNMYPIIEDLPIERIGSYKLLELIGEGGMGSVFKAFDERLQRVVAVKILSSIRAHQTHEKDRFYQEAKAAAQLNHPNVCEVYDVGESDDGHLYIVTAYCEGSDLSKLIAAGQLTLGNILDYLIQLCSALQAAHVVKIVHRDIKPANVIVHPKGLVRLVDFGIAKVLGKDISVSNQLIGTFAYMSPEQFNASGIDGRSDIWSTGIVLYQCLTGKKPYSSDRPAEVMFQIFNGQLPQIDNANLPLAEQFNHVLRRCLNIDKQSRFASMDALANELQALKRQLYELNALSYIPAREPAASKPKESPTTQTIAEYRKVIALALRFKSSPASKSPLDAVKKCVRQHYGQISDIQDDCVYAYFGFPKIGERAAENALACAFALVKESPPDSIDLIAVHSAPIVISHDANTGIRNIQSDIPSAMTDLISLRPPHPIIVSESANRRLRKPLVANCLWESPATSEDALYNLDPDDQKSPFVELNSQYFSPIIGRVHELGLLESGWQQVRDGDGGMAFVITGDAGIGKSRLLHEFTHNHNVISVSHTILECACDPNRQETPLFPLVNALQQYTGISSTSTKAQAKSWLHNISEQLDTFVDVFSWLLGVSDAEIENFCLKESPESLKHLSHALLEQLLQHIAAAKPLVFMVEDLHWSDMATIEWLDRLLTQQLPRNVLVLLTGRPELFQRWRSYGGITQLSLGNLTRHGTSDLIRTYFPDQIISPLLAETVVKKTGGNPLFVEEYLRMLRDKNVNPEHEMFSSNIPERLEDVLLSRFDKLGRAKSLAQVASVIGRHFDFDLLLKLCGYESGELRFELGQMIEAELIFRVDENQYCFKHALIRDALYASLKPEDRKELHELVAVQLESAQTEQGQDIAESVAIHFSLATLCERSREWWLNAIQFAEERYAISDIMRLCAFALKENARCAASQRQTEMEMQLQMALGRACMSANGYADSKAGIAHQEAVRLGKQLQFVDQAFPSFVGLWAYYCVSAQHSKALAIAEEMLAYANAENLSEFVIEACMCRGATAMFVGDLPTSIHCFSQAIALFNSQDFTVHIRKYGQDPRVVIYSFFAIIEEAQGNADTALSYSESALNTARSTNHPFSLAYALGFAVHIRIRQKQMALAKELIEENRVLCEKHHIHVFQLLGKIQLDILNIFLGNVADGMEGLNTHIPQYKKMGAEIFVAGWHALMATCYLQAGKLDRAQHCLDDGVNQMTRTAEWFNKPLLDSVAANLKTTINLEIK